MHGSAQGKCNGSCSSQGAHQLAKNTSSSPLTPPRLRHPGTRGRRQVGTGIGRQAVWTSFLAKWEQHPAAVCTSSTLLILPTQSQLGDSFPPRPPVHVSVRPQRAAGGLQQAPLPQAVAGGGQRVGGLPAVQLPPRIGQARRLKVDLSVGRACNGSGHGVYAAGTASSRNGRCAHPVPPAATLRHASAHPASPRPPAAPARPPESCRPCAAGA